MKKLRLLLLSTIMICSCVSILGYSVHSDEDYMSNPEYARADAEWYERNGDVDKAIICYKKYAALSGTDMSWYITKLNDKIYPEWFNSATMKALPLSEGKVLIVYMDMIQQNVWDESFSEDCKVPGVVGDWEKCIGEEEYKIMQKNGIYIPYDGLYAGKVGSGANLGTKIIISGRVIEIPNESRSLSIYLMTNDGRKSINCGSYSKKGKINGTSVNVETNDSRKNLKVSYYPHRVIKKDNGIWRIEKTSYSLDDRASSSIRTVQKTK
ncbi:MAG: hypothetical protein K2K97_05405 [Muribaculaceae bacterium]|nr:hypothetical protein [Muribaculaceae bacterium]